MNETTVKAKRIFAGLGIWNVYFIAKFLLFGLGYLKAQILANIALFCFLLIPVPGRALGVLRQIAALIAGVAILWSESWLPGPESLMSNVSGITGFSFNYVMELVWDWINWQMVIAGCALVLLYYAVRDFVRVTAITGCWLAFIAAGPLFTSPAIRPAANRPMAPVAAQTADAGAGTLDSASGTGEARPEEIEAWYKTFLEYESERQAQFPTSISSKDTPFDILILNICSLSNDDLETSGLAQHRVFSRFNIRFDKFNTATSYSGPAALRLLNAACGQPSHTAMYDARRPDCEIMNRLDSLGFKQHLFLDHSGAYDNYLNTMRTQAGLTAPLEKRRYPLKYMSFNNEEIADTLSVLRHWRSVVTNDKAKHTVSLFNFIALHDGNRLPGQSRWQEFQPRARMFLDDLNTFMNDIERSKRHVMLIVVPEHGAAVRGDRIQTSRLRDIPSRRITQVPTMVKFFGIQGLPKNQVHVTSDASYLALATLIGRVIESNYFSKPGGAVTLEDLVRDLPVTHMVSENGQAVVLEYKGKDYMKMSRGTWQEYDSGQ